MLLEPLKREAKVVVVVRVLAPTIAEQARTALAVASFGNLAVLDTNGRPIVTTVPITDDGQGRPVLVVSNLAAITTRIRRDYRGGMNISDRLMIQGDLTSVPGIQQIETQKHLIAKHPNMVAQVESLDFSWFRLVATNVCWIDDAGDERWITPDDLANAQPDPLAHLCESDIAETAERIGDDLIVMVRGLSGLHQAKRARLAGVDRYGLIVEIDEPGVTRKSRVPFPQRLEEASEMHAAIAALVQAGRMTPSAKEASLGIEQNIDDGGAELVSDSSGTVHVTEPLGLSERLAKAAN